MHRARQDDPPYQIKSDKTDHVAAHKGSGLHRVT
ncbi:HVA1 family protein [Janibacter sp. Soil728]|nr:HVA1 family protein [Janibacter sp. Soil728]